MNTDIYLLSLTAVSIGFIHTLIGPDHYLPFIVISKARSWTFSKTMFITFICGLGHVLSSVLLGLIGIGLGVLLAKLEFLESFRGNLAAWALITFGILYFIWGLKKAYKNEKHTHIHVHNNGSQHIHEHQHNIEHVHAHSQKSHTKANITPWVLFIIFVLGPCEPLIPLLMYPASKSSISGMVLISLLFSITTIATMLTMVAMFYFGLNKIKLGFLERYAHATAGAVIAISGLAIQFLGL